MQRFAAESSITASKTPYPSVGSQYLIFDFVVKVISIAQMTTRQADAQTVHADIREQHPSAVAPAAYAARHLIQQALYCSRCDASFSAAQNDEKQDHSRRCENEKRRQPAQPRKAAKLSADGGNLICAADKVNVEQYLPQKICAHKVKHRKSGKAVSPVTYRQYDPKDTDQAQQQRPKRK